jgi:HEPN domain-containing protein
MIDFNKQIEYWLTGAINDIDTAEILIANKKFVHGLFFCHLSIEKILKALLVKETGDLPPKSHNLQYIQELAKVQVSEEDRVLISILMKYQLEGRYPDYRPETPSMEIINSYLSRTKALLECLKQKL